MLNELMIAKSCKCLQPFNLIESPYIEVLFLVPCASATIPGNSIAGFCSISKVISDILSYCGYSEKGACRAFRNADFKAHLRLAKYLFAIWYQGLQQASPLLDAIFISQILRERLTTHKHWCGYGEAEMVQGMPNSSPHNTATRFQMRAPIHPNCAQQIQLLRVTMFFSNMQVRSNVAPSPFLLWLSHSKSICNKLISPGAFQPPWPHTGCTFSICCLSSQVHGMLSASCHSSYNFRLSKAFYNWIQDGESRQNQYVTFHTLPKWKIEPGSSCKKS